MKSIQRGSFFSALVCLVLFFGCGGDSSTSITDSNTHTETGTLSISLTDASTTNYLAIYVTIDEVRVHKFAATTGNSGWVTVATPRQTYNLLQLVNGLTAILGESELEAATYHQIRLMIGSIPESATNIVGEPHPYANYVILNDGVKTIEELKIPSGFRSGIKLVHRFDIPADAVVELVLDFDACRSVVATGRGGYRLRPTIKVIDTHGKSVLYGAIADFETNFPIPMAQVTAQMSDGLSATVVRSTLTSDGGTDAGQYRLTLSPNQEYNIVAYSNQKVGPADSEEMYAPACSKIMVLKDGDTRLNFALSKTDFGTISGDVSTEGTIDPADPPVIYINIYSLLTCGYVEIASLPMSAGINGDAIDFSVDLPLGTYDVVASSDGFMPDMASSLDILSSGEKVNANLRLSVP